MLNPYVPSSGTIESIYSETDSGDIRSFYVRLEGSLSYLPGQFAMISVFGSGECPIGFASSPTEKNLRFTVKRIGVVTGALHDLEESATIGIRGPYGNGWPLETIKGRNLLIVGGGFAFTTLRSVVNYVLHRKNRRRFGELIVIYGARSPGDLIFKQDLEKWRRREDVKLFVTVDKGDRKWKGLEGYVPTILKEVAPASSNTWSLVCGPPAMIEFTIPVLDELGFAADRILLSLEMKMKCGTGKCGRCNVGYKYVCLDGPVFSLEELKDLQH